MLNAKNVSSNLPNPQWTRSQQKFLQVLQAEENRQKTPYEICNAAGYATVKTWYDAMKDPAFAATVGNLGLKVQHRVISLKKMHLAALSRLKEAQQRIWEVLQRVENHKKFIGELCALAQCSRKIWAKAFQDQQFAARVEELRMGPTTKKIGTSSPTSRSQFGNQPGRRTGKRCLGHEATEI